MSILFLSDANSVLILTAVSEVFCCCVTAELGSTFTFGFGWSVIPGGRFGRLGCVEAICVAVGDGVA